MMNSEAFDEGFGNAGWWLQRLGAFSVERGGRNEQAKRYAIDAVKRGQEVLVIFPEGEIYYLNDLVQPFKSGVVEIGMQAVVESRRTRPDWTAYLVPMAIKYRYRQPIDPILERRTRLMERHLFRRIHGDSLPRRLGLIMAELLHRQEMIHHLEAEPGRIAELGERVQEVRQQVLSRAEEQYTGLAVGPRAQTMDRTWRLSSYLRGLLRQGRQFTAERRAGIPHGPGGAEARRPDGGVAAAVHGSRPVAGAAGGDGPQAGARGLRDQAAAPTGQAGRVPAHRRTDRPGAFMAPYLQDAQAIRHGVAEQLRDVIQALIDALPTARTRAD